MHHGSLDGRMAQSLDHGLCCKLVDVLATWVVLLGGIARNLV